MKTREDCHERRRGSPCRSTARCDVRLRVLSECPSKRVHERDRIDVEQLGPRVPAVGSQPHVLPREDGTAIVDRVRYELPLGVLAELARIAVVHRDLEQIFDYRQEAASIALSAGCGTP